MKLFWRVFLAATVSFTVILGAAAVLLVAGIRAEIEGDLYEHNRIATEHLSVAIERGAADQQWPFEALSNTARSQDFLFWFIVTPEDRVFLSDKAARYGAAPRDLYPSVPKELPPGTYEHSDKKNGLGIIIQRLNVRGEEWQLWLGFSTGEALRESRKAAAVIACIFLLSLLVFAVAAYYTTSRYLKPLSALARGAELIGAGSLSHRVSAGSGDELALLAGSFNAMAESLDRRTAERQLAEAELNRYKEHLEALVKERTAELERVNSELEAFTYSASHDLKAPIRRVEGFLSLVESDLAGKVPAVTADYIGRARKACGQMNSVIENLLKLSRISHCEVSLAETDLCALARAALEGRRAADPGRRAELVSPERLPVRGDAGLLAEAIENLIGNAWKFTSLTPAAVIELGVAKEGGENVYFVRDNGVGFDAAGAEGLFKPFKRFHSGPDYKGTGIGLSIVKRIIERHGGRVWAVSSPGRGAAFYFTLGQAASGGGLRA